MRVGGVFWFAGEDLRARPCSETYPFGQLESGNLIPIQPVDVLEQGLFTGTRPPHLLHKFQVPFPSMCFYLEPSAGS